MNEERRPDEVETANTATMKSTGDDNTRPAALSRGDRTVNLVQDAVQSLFATMATCRRDLALMEQHRANGGTR